MTLTLEIDDVLGERLHRLAEREGVGVDRIAIEALTDITDEEADVIAAVEEALAEDPADSMSIEEFADERKRLRAERMATLPRERAA